MQPLTKRIRATREKEVRLIRVTREKEVRLIRNGVAVLYRRR
jgi:hypothetical protein